MSFRKAVASLLCGCLLPWVAAASSGRAASTLDAPREDASYSEHYFDSGDGITKLHADVLRPKGLGDNVKTPVILTVSPYLNHSGSTSELQPQRVRPE